MKNIVVVGGGVIGWFTAAFLKKKHSDLNITLIESPNVPILGVGESTIPQLGELLQALEIDQFTWMEKVHGIFKYSNHFVGWNSDKPKQHVTDHWNAPLYEQQNHPFAFTFRDKAFVKSLYSPISKDDFFYDNDGRYGIDQKSFDYWLELVRQGKYSWWESAQYFSEHYYPSMSNKSPYDWDNELYLGPWNQHAWHIDAERFPIVVRDMVALPLGVNWVRGHIEHVSKTDDGYVDKLILKDGSELKADLYCDCSGFNRVLMKTMNTEWINLNHLPTQSAWVAPVKYNDPYKEMKPYTQSYAQDKGWNFIITLYSRMGSGYIFDKNFEDVDEAREKFIKYWDGYEFIREPRLLQWEQGYYKDAWINNVVGIGMGQGFIDPMEANSIYVAQACIEMLEKAISKYKNKKITQHTKRAYSKHIQRLEKQIADFVSYHFTLSKRRDNDFWKHWGQFGIENGHIEQNWKEYKSPNNYFGRNIFLDFQWALQHNYLDQWNDSYCKLDIKPKLLSLAEQDFKYINNKGKALAEYLPHIYDWTRNKLHGGATHEEVLQQALSER